MLASEGGIDDAMKQTDAALKIAPMDVSALRMKAELLAKKGDMAGLDNVLTLLEKAAPESGLGEFGKGRLYRAQKKYPEAIAAFDEALKHEPDSALILSELVNTYLAEGDPDTAEARLQTILKEQPKNPAVHFLLGSVLQAKMDYPGAEAEFKKQLRINPKSSGIYLVIAKLRAGQGDLKGAEAILKEGLDILPDNASLKLNLASVYVGEGNDAAAEDLYKEGITGDEKGERFEFGLASLYGKEKKDADAIALYQKMIARNPKNLIATNNLAVLLARKEDLNSRDMALKLALKLADSKEPALLDTLGWIYYGRGEYDKAAKVLADVVGKAPGVAVFNYHLGMTYYKQGDKRAARTFLEKAVAGKVPYDGLEEARQALSRIGKQ